MTPRYRFIPQIKGAPRRVWRAQCDACGQKLGDRLIFGPKKAAGPVLWNEAGSEVAQATPATVACSRCGRGPFTVE